MPRTFNPLYVPTNDEAKDRLAFIHLLENLKIAGPESIADHMYRMAVLALSSDITDIDITKCVMMCLVHDLAEAQVGDIAPREGIPKVEKQRLEAEAMKNIVQDMLHNSAAARKMDDLWKEYEEGATAEAQFVKDLDRFEMASQAFEYERRSDSTSLQSFFDSSIPKISHPEVKRWGDGLLDERKRMWEGRSENAKI